MTMRRNFFYEGPKGKGSMISNPYCLKDRGMSRSSRTQPADVTVDGAFGS